MIRLRVFGRNSDDKGTQLEQLTRRLLERLGYRQVSLNVVTSGGSEIDVSAEYHVPGPTGASILRVIGECKAYASPVALTDWLKFLGKVYSEELRWPGQVRGLFVALSGANGNVRGAADELKRLKGTIDLVDGDNLIQLVQQEFPVAPLGAVVQRVAQLTTDPVTEFSLGYYAGRAFWTLQFADGAFSTLLGRHLDETPSDDLVHMMQEQLQASNYRDLRQEEEYRRRHGTVRKLVLGRLLAQPLSSLSRNALLEHEGDFAPTEAELDTIVTALASEGLIVITGDQFALADVATDDQVRVKLYRELTDGVTFLSALFTPGWLSLIDERLLRAVLAIQGNLPLPEDRFNECISLLRWSPTALAWALRPDAMLLQHRTGPAMPVSFDANDIRYFRVQLLRYALYDFSVGPFAEQYLERLDLREVEFFRRAKFKSGSATVLEVELNERFATARTTPDLGGGVVRIWVHDNAPEPWNWGKETGDTPDSG